MSTNRSVRVAALLGAVVVLGAVALSAGPTFAAKGGAHGSGHGGGGGTGGTASIKLNQTDPHLGDWVKFTTTVGSTIALDCNQGLGNDVFYVSQPVGTLFLLGGTSSLWLS